MKLKIGTRVIVDEQETFISELHKDITRGVYKVRTSNPTYEFTNSLHSNIFTTITHDNRKIDLIKAPKYKNYKIGDRVKDATVSSTPGVIQNITNDAIFVNFNGVIEKYTRCGRSSDCNNTVDLKRIRVKIE